MISVIIPVYNSENTIEKCLDSLLKQTYQDFELVIVNDGSTDNSLGIIEKYKIENQLENMQVISIENHGQGFARNVGIRQSKGEFICFVDSDDAVKEKYLEHMIDKMDEETEMVVGQIERRFAYKPSIVEKSFKYSEELKSLVHETVETYPDLMLEVINAPYAKLIRKKFLIENQVFFPEDIIYEDMVFTHKILAAKARLNTTQEKDYLYMVRKGSTMTGNKSINDIFIAMDQVIENYSSIKVNKDYLDYFIFHHVCIGGMYRTVKMDFKKSMCYYNKAKIYITKKANSLRTNSLISNKDLVIKFYAHLF